MLVLMQFALLFLLSMLMSSTSGISSPSESYWGWCSSSASTDSSSDVSSSAWAEYYHYCSSVCPEYYYCSYAWAKYCSGTFSHFKAVWKDNHWLLTSLSNVTHWYQWSAHWVTLCPPRPQMLVPPLPGWLQPAHPTVVMCFPGWMGDLPGDHQILFKVKQCQSSNESNSQT